MKTKLTLLALTLGASTFLLSAQDGPPPSDSQQPPQHEGAPGAGGEHGGFHLLPPRAQEQLKLTADQRKQITALEAETKTKLEKILTADQLTQLKNFRPPMRGGMGGQQRGGMGRGGNGPEGGDGNMPPAGPPPGEDDNSAPPSGPPPGDK